MTITIEMICKECNSNDCKNHTPVKTKRDAVTSLEIEARCCCSCGGSK